MTSQEYQHPDPKTHPRHAPRRMIGTLTPHAEGGWHGTITPKDGAPMQLRLYPYGVHYEAVTGGNGVFIADVLWRERSFHHWSGHVDGIPVRIYGGTDENGIPSNMMVVKQVFAGARS